ncbi:MAG: DNA-processing protein DprA [Deltaproteobacteria bacterium]|nr:DNA-processing protein DprA [Deltaproteobacteria bacterium]
MGNELIYWSLLAHTNEIKRKTKFQILDLAEAGLKNFIEAGLPGLDSATRKKTRPVWEDAANQALVLQDLDHRGISLVIDRDTRYPERLRTSLKDQAPLLLYAAGNPSLMSAERTVAIIGARDATPFSMALAGKAAAFFAGTGYVVVSGFARGIDRGAFNGSLAGGGATIAVLPHGLLDKSSLEALGRHTGSINSGQVLFISEVHPRAPWQAGFAIMRNRLIAGLADFVIVIHAGPKSILRQGRQTNSGTWQAAACAQKLGRQVFVLDLPEDDTTNRAMAEELGRLIPVTKDDGMFRLILEEISHLSGKDKIIDDRTTGRHVQGSLGLQF